jgi:glutamyl-tRNA synthetase
MPARGRFAPTPSGPLHLGSLFTALLAWLQARTLGGAFVLRVEDLDRARALPVVDAQLEALRRLGIDWDEGPDVGGRHAPYLQSRRPERYAQALALLEEHGLVYRCHCSRTDVLRAAEAGASEELRYPGTCRALEPDEVQQRQERQAALRLKVPSGTVAFEDLVCGPMEQDVQATVGDFVLQRADGVVAYQLAVVVDDIAMGITHVLRGRDLLSSTARQLLLYRALGAPPPLFAHVPLLLGPDGEKLSKRNGGAVPADFDPPRVLAQLAALAGLSPDRPRTASDLIGAFEPDHLRHLPAALTLAPGDLSS